MQEQSRRVSLPGLMYQQAGQWWWQVQLPGEDTARNRPLEVPGVGTAECDAETAERVAVEMWQQAVLREGTRRILLDCTQKIERFKARFLGRLSHLTEIVESATARAQAETHARAEIESKLHAIILAAGFHPEELGHRTTASTCGPWDLPAVSRTAASGSTGVEGGAARSEVGFCECCGTMDIPTPDLERIDSGQWLCPNCLHSLRLDVLQAELDALAHSLT